MTKWRHNPLWYALNARYEDEKRQRERVTQRAEERAKNRPSIDLDSLPPIKDMPWWLM